MKKLLTILMVALIALAAAGCGQQSNDKDTDKPTEAASNRMHTVPPTEAQEPEWAPVDCEIELHSSDAVYADSKAFRTFALVGSADDNCELRFTLDDETAAMLSKESRDKEYYLIVNEKTLKGDVSLNDDCTEVTMKGGYSYNEMCILATEIRGL